MEITAEQATISHLSSQLLWDKPKPRSAENIAKQISYIQLDTILAIARSHDLVLFSRSSSYKEETVWKALKSRKLFEDYAHARCLIPMESLKYHVSAMLRRRDFVPKWYELVDKENTWKKNIVKFIEENGPTRAGDIETPENFPSHLFTGWNTANKRMCEYLSSRGYLAVTKREKFQIYFDIPERVLPNFQQINEDLPDEMEVFWHHIKTTLKAVGFAPLDRLLQYKYIQGQMIIGQKKVLPRNLIKIYLKEGDLVEVIVEGQKKPFYSLQGKLDQMDDLQLKDNNEFQVFLLSPLDSALWTRESILSQYDFDFKVEIYVPKQKRKFGYFVLPILYGPNFVGRVDVKLHRKDKMMDFIKWSWETEFAPSTNFWRCLALTIKRFVKFHHAEKIEFGNLKPKFRNKLKSHMELN
ncbi:MAG: YcaQ family DNA glycosylase [Candidatus Heimdallarchaeota archaeon]|nr:YcaQ family DNA glycosylase [Candidatus Heimdallarchaeota archaeon]